MDRDRLQREIDALSKKYHIVPNQELQGYELRDFNYPDGWVLVNRERWRRRDGGGVPRGPGNVAPLLVRIPDAYPSAQPYAYIPRDMRHTEREISHVIRTEFEDWWLWCVHDIDWRPGNQKSTLPKFLQLMQLSFSRPDLSDPIAEGFTE